LTTLPYFSTSCANEGEPRSGVAPESAKRALMVKFSKAELISLFSLSTISGGVFLGALRPANPIIVARDKFAEISDFRDGRLLDKSCRGTNRR
jgi:hypothetical protein